MSAGWLHWLEPYSWGKKNTKSKSCSYQSYVLLGTGLLWFGWFGFNAGSALGSNGLAVPLGTTTVAAAAAGMTWVFLDKILGHKLSAMGACIEPL
jgi:Amt family ammonium transporter